MNLGYAYAIWGWRHADDASLSQRSPPAKTLKIMLTAKIMLKLYD